MKGINYGRFISVYQSQDGGYIIICCDMYYNISCLGLLVTGKLSAVSCQ